MYTVNKTAIDGTAVTEIVYKGQTLPVTGVTIRWLSKEGKDAKGGPEFGLRHFTMAPGGSIPMHNHFYLQTMYIESGRVECSRHDPDTDEIVEKWTCGPGDAIHTAAWEPHSMRNLSDAEPVTFLCCICNVYEDEDKAL